MSDYKDYVDLNQSQIQALYQTALSGRKTRTRKVFNKDGELVSTIKEVETTPKLAAQSLMFADVVLNGELGINDSVRAIHGKTVNHMSRPKRLAVDIVPDVVSNSSSQVNSVSQAPVNSSPVCEDRQTTKE